MNINIISHYRKLIFFALRRYEGSNYAQMRNYFATILVHDLKKYISPNKKNILDVGGSSGEFSKYIGETFDCKILNLDPHPMNPVWDTVTSSADKMPFESNKFDLIFFRGVLEHIKPSLQQDSIDEIYRVLNTGGVCYLVIPPWYNPHAGHGLKPFHLLPFPLAKFLKNLIFRKKVLYNSLEESSLYKVTHRGTQEMIKKSGFTILDTKDTHLRLHFLTKIPIIREFAVPAVAFIFKK